MHIRCCHWYARMLFYLEEKIDSCTNAPYSGQMNIVQVNFRSHSKSIVVHMQQMQGEREEVDKVSVCVCWRKMTFWWYQRRRYAITFICSWFRSDPLPRWRFAIASINSMITKEDCCRKMHLYAMTFKYTYPMDPKGHFVANVSLIVLNTSPSQRNSRILIFFVSSFLTIFFHLN